MYWIIGKIVASILAGIFLTSPFIKPLRQKWLSWDYFADDTWFGLVYKKIGDREIDSAIDAFEVVMMMICSLLIATIGYFLLVLIYPLPVLILVVMWALKRLYSEKQV